jgi:hydroxymethylpyrimidine/phosphomethylpyrimidine kinase
LHDFTLAPTSVLLTIAGFDPSSGAGITADLAAFAAHGAFGTSVITALTVQSTLGVAAVESVASALVARSLRHLVADLPPAGIKIGMLGSAQNVQAVGAFLRELRSMPVDNPSGRPLPVVLDPVLRSSSGAGLLSPDAIEILHAELLPVVDWITPNWAELAVLAETDAVSSEQDAAKASANIAARHPHLTIVATGGDQQQPVDLLWLPTGEQQRFAGERILSNATHGTGCAFSSALLARLAQGKHPAEAVALAKSYVAEAIRRAPQLGHGKGPMRLLWPLGRGSS